MADASFSDVVKSLKDNKVSQDDGFNRLEAAVKGTDPKSIQEENAKKEASTKNKELNYFANIGNELDEVNKNLKEGFKSLVTPSGALGGIMALIAAPIFFIKGFLTGLLDSFKALGKLFKNTKLVQTIEKFFKGKGSITTYFQNLFKNMSNLLKNSRIFRQAKIFFNRTMPNFFKGIFGKDILKNIKSGFKFVMQPFKMIGDIIKMFTSGTGGIGGALKTFKSTFSAITKFAGTIGRILGRLFLPLTFIMTAFDTIMGAIDGFKGTDGNIVQKILGGLGGAIKGFMKLVTVPLDLVKSLISWIAGKFGFTEFEKLLDGFSFTELFGKAVDWLFVDLPAFFTNLFSWNNIKATLSAGLDIANEFGKTVQRLIHKGLNFIKSLFGFGDKGDFAESEMPVTKDVRAFLTFEWVNDLLKPVTDFFKKIMDFDFIGFIKKIPGVGFLLDKMRSKTEDEKLKEEIAELEDDLAGAYFFKSGRVKDEKKLAELKEKLRMDATEGEQLVPKGQDVAPLKTANLAGRKPSGGSDFKDIDPSEMTEEQLKAAMIDYNKEKNKLRGGRRFQFDRANKDLRRALSQRRRDFRDQAEEEGNVAGKITQAQLDKIVVGGGGSSTVVNNTTNAPVNNNNTSSSYSPPTNPDPTIERAKMAAFR